VASEFARYEARALEKIRAQLEAEGKSFESLWSAPDAAEDLAAPERRAMPE
jgi:hypothetical protein